MKHYSKKIISIIAVLLVNSLTGCSEEVIVHKKTLRPVKHITVHKNNESMRNRVFSGSTNSAHETNLSFKVSGNIKSIAVVVGDKIKRGDLIAQLDSETYLVELEQAKASLAKALATRRQSEAEYQRVRKLYSNNNTSRNELDTALANAESAKAAYNADKQNVRLAELNLSYTKLQANSDCTVAELTVEPNENISSGTVIGQLNCGNAWEVKISVSETLISAFKNGLSGNVKFTSIKGNEYLGVVTEIGASSKNSKAFPVTLSLNEAPNSIRSGLAAEVTFKFSHQVNGKSNFYLAPSVIGQDNIGTFIYVMEKTDKANTAILRRREIKIGDISELGIEVLEGLNDGERVITAGQSSARDGMLVLDNN